MKVVMQVAYLSYAGYSNLHTMLMQPAYRRISGVDLLYLSVDTWNAMVFYIPAWDFA